MKAYLTIIGKDNGSLELACLELETKINKLIGKWEPVGGVSIYIDRFGQSNAIAYAIQVLVAKEGEK